MWYTSEYFYTQDIVCRADSMMQFPPSSQLFLPFLEKKTKTNKKQWRTMEHRNEIDVTQKSVQCWLQVFLTV